MKQLLLLSALVLLHASGPALAQEAYQFADAGTKNFISQDSISPGEQISLDLWLTNVSQNQSAGGAWIDFTGSTGLISYVSGGRCLTNGSEGCTGPWAPGGGYFINEPDAGSGPIQGAALYIVAKLAFPYAVPDADGDLIVGTLTLECDAPGDAAVDLTVIPGVATWAPVDDASVQPATLSLSQPSTTTSVPGGTTTSSVNPTTSITSTTSLTSTTSSSASPRFCLVEQVYGEDAAEAALCRHLRDRVLSKTDEGRELIRAYYAWSPQLVRALEKEPALKDEIKKVLDQVLLLIEHGND